MPYVLCLMPYAFCYKSLFRCASLLRDRKLTVDRDALTVAEESVTFVVCM